MGTAVAWLGGAEVFTAIKCRAQVVTLKGKILYNIYAPSGTNSWTTRRDFFARDIFNLFLSQREICPF